MYEYLCVYFTILFECHVTSNFTNESIVMAVLMGNMPYCICLQYLTCFLSAAIRRDWWIGEMYVWITLYCIVVCIYNLPSLIHL
jgi:hypothetical protein